MKRLVKFIYNPYSGENKILSNLDYIIKAYQNMGYSIIPFRFTNETNISDAFTDVNDSFHHILVGGGDGTVNVVVNAMKNVGISIPLAVLPAGTANDFAKLIGFSSSIKTACHEILSGDIREVDLGQANESYFVNVLSSGLFTEVSQKTPTVLKNTFGKLAYYFSSIQELPNFKKIHLNVESEDLVYNDNSLIIFVFNGRTAGNMNLAYRSDVQDGLLDVLIIKGDNIVDTINTAFHFIVGSNREYPRGVVHFKSKELTILSDDQLSVDIDGEAGPQTPMKVKCIEKGLRIIVPKNTI